MVKHALGISLIIAAAVAYAATPVHVLRWLNANVQTAMYTGFLRLLSVTIFSVFNDVFGYPRTAAQIAGRRVPLLDGELYPGLRFAPNE